MLIRYSLLLVFIAPSAALLAEETLLDGRLHHLRQEGPREWEEFPETQESSALELTFNAAANANEQTLRLHQQDVKQRWRVRLNEKDLGRLRINENAMVIYLAVPPGTLVSGKNTLRIEQESGRRQSSPDDIRVGKLVLDSRPRGEILAESTVDLTVVDETTGEPTPSRITILDADGALHECGADSNDHLAVRPGTVFTANGHARFGLPAGRYTIYAGRGFEYSLARQEILLSKGDTLEKNFSIRREVPTEGYVACDTHVHTLTHSGHGDASVEERMITLASEGIELPIATDHNVHIDHAPFARELNVAGYFTPVIGNEMTTKVGHFNIFPIPSAGRVPDHTLTEWPAIFNEIRQTAKAPVVILNHARDLHGGVRPFGPKRHIALVAESSLGWSMDFNGMEVINSGATQTDVMQLFHDWMAVLNRGGQVAPVGSSDSHDVARHFVGQGRTYIKCDDSNLARINVSDAVDSFLAGRVMVSYGLLAELHVSGRGSGELVPVEGEQIEIDARVLAPHWIDADRIELFVNGVKVRQEEISATAAAADNDDDNNDDEKMPPGVKWQGRWTLPKPKHDVHLVAIARGPGVAGSYWKSAKPYQPTSPRWTPQVIGCSGAIWLDIDGDGRKSSARDYAQRLHEASQGDLPKLLKSLAGYDQAVAAHAAHLLQTSGVSLAKQDVQNQLEIAAPAVREGFRNYIASLREHERAQFVSSE